MSGPEKRYEEKLKRYLKKRGIWYVKYWGGGLYTKTGVPDILACIKGRFVAIEVKSDSGKLRPEQKEEIALINASGGLCIISRPSTFEKDKALIEKILQEA